MSDIREEIKVYQEEFETAATETKMLNTRIPAELIKQIKLYCVANDMTIQDFIIEASQDKLGKVDIIL